MPAFLNISMKPDEFSKILNQHYTYNARLEKLVPKAKLTACDYCNLTVKNPQTHWYVAKFGTKNPYIKHKCLTCNSLIYSGRNTAEENEYIIEQLQPKVPPKPPSQRRLKAIRTPYGTFPSRLAAGEYMKDQGILDVWGRINRGIHHDPLNWEYLTEYKTEQKPKGINDNTSDLAK